MADDSYRSKNSMMTTFTSVGLEFSSHHQRLPITPIGTKVFIEVTLDHGLPISNH